MKAMILAAGLGTRLRPLTNDRPKALVEVGGHTLLEITLMRLREFGVREVIVNAHHCADKIVDYLRAKQNFGMRIEISREEALLDTGGGLTKAEWFFQREASQKTLATDEPFILHNVDVISTIDLKRMVDLHTSQKALVTLAVQNRKSSRVLLFDESGKLCGRRADPDRAPEITKKFGQLHELAFSGIHAISPRLLSLMTETGAFSIIDVYLRLAAAGEKIFAFRADECYWRDLGKPENLVQAEKDLQNGALS